MAILDALEPQLVRLRMSYAKTPLPRFFSWWGGELVALLPARWRAALAERAEALLLDLDGGQVIVRRTLGESVSELGRIDLAKPAEEQRLEFAVLRDRIDVPVLRQYLCIPSARTLRRSLSLPAAAEDRLRQVLAFEMDRQTPFKAEQVYFDYRVTGRDAGGRNLHVDLAVIPRAQLDTELASLNGLGQTLDGVDCWRDRDAGTRLGINLLPVERRARRKNLRLRLNLALAAGAVILLGLVMAQSVSNREAALAAMTDAVTKKQAEAKQVMALRKTLDDTIDSANFLAEKKHTTVTMSELLDDVTKRLPDNTYLERLNLTEDNRLELQGLSDEASNLIAKLQASDLLTKIAFQGVIQPDVRVKKERFNLLAQVKPKESKDARPKDTKDAAKGGDANAPAAGDK